MTDHMRYRLFIVRHVSTGCVLPPAMGHRGRGGSFWDPTEPDYFDTGIPRLFHNRKAAVSFITQWARGLHLTTRSKGDWYAGIEPEEETIIEDVGRSKDMLVAVPVTVIAAENGVSQSTISRVKLRKGWRNVK
jgi:hypothetical protein